LLCARLSFIFSFGLYSDVSFDFCSGFFIGHLYFVWLLLYYFLMPFFCFFISFLSFVYLIFLFSAVYYVGFVLLFLVFSGMFFFL